MPALVVALFIFVLVFLPALASAIGTFLAIGSNL